MHSSVEIKKFHNTKYQPIVPKDQPNNYRDIFLANIAVYGPTSIPVDIHVVKSTRATQPRTILSAPVKQVVLRSTHYTQPAQTQFIQNIPSKTKRTNTATIAMAAVGCIVAISLVIIAVGPGFDRVASLLAML